MKAIDRAFEWLKAEGYAPTKQENVVEVKYQGWVYFIPDVEPSESFLKIDLGFPVSELQSLTAEKCLELVNQVNSIIRLVKATIREEAIVYSAETMVCEADDFGQILPNLLETLRIAAGYTFEQIAPNLNK